MVTYGVVLTHGVIYRDDVCFYARNNMFEFPITSLVAFIGMPGLPEMAIIGAIFLLIFGGAKLPSLMRNLGRSVNEFKHGIKETPADANIEDGSDKEAV